MAAYRLARGAGAAHPSAFHQAVDATYENHFDYRSNNQPRVMQGIFERLEGSWNDTIVNLLVGKGVRTKAWTTKR